MNAYLPIGERIAIYRRRRGLSQMRLGGLIGRSEDWVSKVERGDLPIDRMSVLVRVAEALRVQLGDLIRDPITPDAGQRLHEGIADLRQALISVPASAANPAQAGDSPPSLATLRRNVVEIHQLRAQVRHADSLVPLPGLLARLQLATTTYSGDEQVIAFGLLVQGYELVGRTLGRYGAHDLAWISADRAVHAAERSGRPDDQLLAAYALTHALMTPGKLGDATAVGQTALGRARPYLRNRRVRALSGALSLALSVVAARQGDRSASYAAINEAAACTRNRAGRVDVPRDVAEWTQYGPANVEVHRISTAVDLGDSGEALRLARSVDLNGLSASRRSRHLLDVALAHSYRRDTDQMVQTLLEIERFAPERLINSPLAREMLYGALRRERGLINADLHALADRIGAT